MENYSSSWETAGDDDGGGVDGEAFRGTSSSRRAEQTPVPGSWLRDGGALEGSELYIMESFHDIRMVNNRSVVEQAHEIQCIAKELELLKCALPDKFVAGCIIAKLPPSWRNFATTLKHKRQEISVENLIASLDVEEKARAKDNTEKGEGQSSANMVQKKPYSKNKGNNKPSFNKPMKTTTFKKKKMINKADLSCFTCGETGHFSVQRGQTARKRRGKSTR
ncbi:hypothetical protein QYE76_049287 [Lolium multiflorum]|uniref:Uncharacterized protein n=1 Tax=Lolium multiflorum TaxID=4521 RepID=A0AAD8SPU5_LOLMU|nr:hypothetical protein QYE76_049287 [Lolium multiflorum]